MMLRGFPAALPGAVVVLLCACAPAHDAGQLLTQLQSADSETRQDAQEKLARILERGDYEVFVRGARDSHGLARAHSILYLSRFGQPGARAALRELLRLENRTPIPFSPIRMKPTSEQTDSRILVANLVHQTGGDPEAIDLLLAGVDERQPAEILTDTCFAVGALGDARGVPFLARALAHTDEEVVRAAVEALGHIETPEALETLRGMATHPSLLVRTDVLSAVILRDDPAVAGIVRAFAASDPAPEVRSLAVEHLGRQAPAEAVPLLIDRLDDADPGVRATALAVLVRITGTTNPPRSDAWSRWWAANRSRFATPGA